MIKSYKQREVNPRRSPGIRLEAFVCKSIDHTWELFMELREAGSAILLVSEDLNEIMALSDRIAIMDKGRIAGMFEGSEAKREEIGLMIATGATKT